MNIGERIKKARNAKGLNQVNLGKLVNKSSQVISNWERGFTPTINHDDVVKLAMVLDVEPNYLLGIDNKKTTPAEIERKKEELEKSLKLLGDLSEEDKREAIKYMNYLKYTAVGDGETSATLEEKEISRNGY